MSTHITLAIVFCALLNVAPIIPATTILYTTIITYRINKVYLIVLACRCSLNQLLATYLWVWRMDGFQLHWVALTTHGKSQVYFISINTSNGFFVRAFFTQSRLLLHIQTNMMLYDFRMVFDNFVVVFFFFFELIGFIVLLGVGDWWLSNTQFVC